MLKTFTRVAGVAQTAIGLLGSFAPQMTSSMMDSQTGGSVFNVLSGAALSYLGFKGNENSQRMGAQVIGGLNGIVGLLGAFGVDNFLGVQMNQGMAANVINLIIGAWGLFAGFAKKKAGAAA